MIKIKLFNFQLRRGILNASFTLKELRELTRIENVECHIDSQQFKDIEIDKILDKLARPRKRITEYMYNIAKSAPPQPPSSKKVINLVFLRTPVAILGENKRVSGVKLKVNKYDVNFSSADLCLNDEQALNSLPITQVANQPEEILPAGLIIRSIGYKNVNIDSADIPFDKKLGVVINERGKVAGKDGLYCTGWIKRGPRGVIVDTTSDAFETAQSMINDLVSIHSESQMHKAGLEKIKDILKERNVRYVDKEGWARIDEEEVKRGKLAGKPREKFNSIDEMLKVAFNE